MDGFKLLHTLEFDDEFIFKKQVDRIGILRDMPLELNRQGCLRNEGDATFLHLDLHHLLLSRLQKPGLQRFMRRYRSSDKLLRNRFKQRVFLRFVRFVMHLTSNSALQ